MPAQPTRSRWTAIPMRSTGCHSLSTCECVAANNARVCHVNRHSPSPGNSTQPLSTTCNPSPPRKQQQGGPARPGKARPALLFNPSTPTNHPVNTTNQSTRHTRTHVHWSELLCTEAMRPGRGSAVQPACTRSHTHHKPTKRNACCSQQAAAAIKRMRKHPLALLAKTHRPLHSHTRCLVQLFQGCAERTQHNTAACDATSWCITLQCLGQMGSRHPWPKQH